MINIFNYIYEKFQFFLEITSPDIIKSMLKLSRDQNSRIKNLATIFLEDYCTKEQVQKASLSEEDSLVHLTDVAEIPLPESK